MILLICKRINQGLIVKFYIFVTFIQLKYLISRIIRRKEGMKVFSEIYYEYVTHIYRFLLNLCRNESLAEELTQQTFYKAFLNIEKFEQRCSLSTWLCTIAKNEWLLECRKKKSVLLDQIEDLADQGNMEEDLLKKEQQMLVRKTILTLESPYQDVLVLRTYAELSFHEIACIHNKSESWAKVTYLRAKQKIKLKLEENL